MSTLKTVPVHPTRVASTAKLPSPKTLTVSLAAHPRQKIVQFGVRGRLRPSWELVDQERFHSALPVRQHLKVLVMRSALLLAEDTGGVPRRKGDLPPACPGLGQCDGGHLQRVYARRPPLSWVSPLRANSCPAKPGTFSVDWRRLRNQEDTKTKCW